MNIQENTEKVLRQLYLMLAHGECCDNNPSKVIVDKMQAERLLNDLNRCIYEMMEEYEITAQSRDKADRAAMREREQMLKDAKKQAEDVYAASIIYSEESLNRITRAIRDVSRNMEGVFKEINDKIYDEEKRVRRHHSELSSQLYAMKDTEKYLTMMKEWKEAELREAALEKGEQYPKGRTYANRQTPVRVNEELLKQMNLAPVAEASGENADAGNKGDSEEKKASEEKKLSGEKRLSDTEESKASEDQKASGAQSVSEESKASESEEGKASGEQKNSGECKTSNSEEGKASGDQKASGPEEQKPEPEENVIAAGIEEGTAGQTSETEDEKVRGQDNG